MRRDGRDDADQVLLLPGTAGSADELDGLADALATRYTVLRLDLPGTGRSRVWGESLPRLDVAGTATAIAHHLRDAGARPRAVVGHSAGGIVAVEVARALARPPAGTEHGTGPVRGVVLLDTNLPTDPQVCRRKQARATALARLPDRELRVAFTASMRRSWGGADVDGPAYRQVMAGVEAAGDRVIREFWLSVLALDSLAFWRDLELPAVYVHSDRPVAASALDRLTRLVRYVEAGDRAAGHWLHLREPGLTSGLVRDALADLLSDDPFGQPDATV
ncbi:hypothetical protein BKD30_02205 [Tersicoccus phoenicis]|uniref:Thioesterase TesA-like domain-containing protein n=1 Tax=Tersicoccus phoenicis TaxID=554083 RepID=A0A1R1LKU3_9MICC|nr:alpha/beta fold hydrolase [Tersicoccus phoenicis]OMH28167.1 hypothetical protein BKD30_02205 [Tersicoccus phoenicis]